MSKRKHPTGDGIVALMVVVVTVLVVMVYSGVVVEKPQK